MSNNTIAEQIQASSEDTGLFKIHRGNVISVIMKAALQADGAIPEKNTNIHVHTSATSRLIKEDSLNNRRMNMHTPNKIPICNPDMARI